MPADLVSRLDLDVIYPPFLEKFLQVLSKCRDRGAVYVATSGYRSPEEQLQLWKKGRNTAGAVVRPAEVVTRVKFGPHNVGVAVDSVRDLDPKKPGVQVSWASEDYDTLAQEASAQKLDAGHKWSSFKDSPHVQLPLNKHGVSLAKLKDLYDAGGLKSCWAFLDTKGPW